jgi:hypothetical protein
LYLYNIIISKDKPNHNKFGNGGGPRAKKERWRIKDGPLEEACEFVAGIYFAF